MKKLFVLFVIIIFNIGITNLNASCEQAVMDASLVEVFKTESYDYENADVYISAYGLTENIYVKIINDYNDIEREYHYKDVNETGIVGFATDNISKNIKYKILVYSEDESCSLLPLETLEVDTVRFNTYATSALCIGNARETKECAPFYDTKDMTIEDFQKAVDKSVQENKPKELIDYVKQYYLYVLVPIVLGGIIFTISAVVLKRRKKANEI